MPVLKWINGRFMTSDVRIAFVTFSSGRYLGLEGKLRKSIEVHCPEADFFVFHDFAEIGSPTHLQSPYSFKVYAIQKVRNMGYPIVIWCDSAIRVHRSIDTWLPQVRASGVYLQKDGHKVGTWANDRALAYFGVTRDHAMTMSAAYACVMAFDFRNPIANEFFARWKKASEDGIFIGYWKNTLKTESQDERCEGHRHDQTCAELVAYTMDIPLLPRVLSHDITYSNRYFTSFDHP
jgi:hypothetical protein